MSENLSKSEAGQSNEIITERSENHDIMNEGSEISHSEIIQRDIEKVISLCMMIIEIHTHFTLP
jgi:hypothetical protein